MLPLLFVAAPLLAVTSAPDSLTASARSASPCPVDSQARYASLLRLYTALAPDAATGFAPTDRVDELSSVADVTSAVTSGQPIVVMFYAPWCPHCQSTKPVFDRVAQNLTGVKFAQIDASGIADVREPYGVRAYPTIKYFDGLPDAPVRSVQYNWHGAIEDDLRQFVVQNRPAARPTAAGKLEEVLLATQPAAPYSPNECDCSWIDQSVTACDGGDDGTICWRVCCHATVFVTPPKAPFLPGRRVRNHGTAGGHPDGVDGMGGFNRPQPQEGADGSAPSAS